MLKLVRNNEETALVPSDPSREVAPNGDPAAQPGAGALAVQNLHAFEQEQEASKPPAKTGWGVKQLFFLFVILPTIAAGVYLYGFASDQYRAETRFIIKSSQKTASTGLSAILESTGLSTATGDTYAVIDFLTSRDALEELQERTPFEAMMSREDADFLARYPGYALVESFETLYEHYERKVEVVLDSTSGIVRMSVLSFRPDDSLAIADSLLEISEEFIDRLNAASIEDSLRLARESVERAELRAREAQRELTRFRIANGVVDPTIDIKRLSGLTEGLSEQLLELDQRIESLRQSAPRSPQLNILEQARENVVAQIGDQNEELAGEGAETLPGVIAEFSELEIEAEFAVKALEAANISYETARQEALRKQLYLTRVVEPRSTDDSRDPKRLEMLAIFFALLGSAFLITWLLTANMREHAE